MAPALILVVPSEPRSMVVLQPISTSSSMTTATSLRELDLLVSVKHIPEAITANHCAGVNGNSIAKTGSLGTVRREDGECSHHQAHTRWR